MIPMAIVSLIGDFWQCAENQHRKNKIFEPDKNGFKIYL